MRNYLSLRDIRQRKLCGHILELDAWSDVQEGLQAHVCGLKRNHVGPHICYICESWYLADSLIFTQLPLELFADRTN